MIPIAVKRRKEIHTVLGVAMCGFHWFIAIIQQFGSSSVWEVLVAIDGNIDSQPFNLEISIASPIFLKWFLGWRSIFHRFFFDSSWLHTLWRSIDLCNIWKLGGSENNYCNQTGLMILIPNLTGVRMPAKPSQLSQAPPSLISHNLLKSQKVAPNLTRFCQIQDSSTQISWDLTWKNR